MSHDGLRGTTIQYNRLNLPQTVSWGNEMLTDGYLADGQKREKKLNGTATQYYRNGMVYAGDGTPEYVLTPEGMVRNVNGTWVRQYNLTDHLDNVRAVLDENGDILQQTDYHPFGTAYSLGNTDKNRYLYGDKELQNEELGGTPLNMYDFEARFYDPQYLLRFTGIDPMAEKRFNISPYAYCSNNPISRVDPTGMRDTDYRNEKGELLYKTDDGLTDVIIVPDNNIPKLEKKLNEAHAEEKIDDPATNQEEMHVLGKTPQEYSEGPAKGMDSYWRYGYRETYEEAYKEGKSQFSLGQIASSIVAAIATDNDDSSGITRHDGRSSGILDGNYDRENGKINRLNPHSSFKNNKPLLTVPKLEPIKRYPGVGLPPM